VKLKGFLAASELCGSDDSTSGVSLEDDAQNLSAGLELINEADPSGFGIPPRRWYTYFGS